LTCASDGGRGSEYAWAYSRRLQVALEDANVGYTHLKELAPTTELRELQYSEDERRGEGKRSRTVLASEYVSHYTEEILDPVDLVPIVRWVGDNLRGAAVCRRTGPAGLPPVP
jgi:hypothetical protein